jgi:hypothetical protein
MEYQAPPPAPAPAHSFGERVVGAVKLERPVYDEVRRDPSAMMQAAAVVGATGLLSGIGQFAEIRGQEFEVDNRTYHVADSFLVPLGGGIGIALTGLVFWVIAAVLFRFVGVRMLGSPETSIQWQEIARPLGFASAPGLLTILTPIPILGFLVSSVVGIWVLAAQIVSMSEVFRVSKWRAFAIMLVAWLGASLILSLLLCICIFAAAAVV